MGAGAVPLLRMAPRWARSDAERRRTRMTVAPISCARRSRAALLPRRPGRSWDRRAEAEWNEKFAAYEQQYSGTRRELSPPRGGELPPGWDANIPHNRPPMQRPPPPRRLGENESAGDSAADGHPTRGANETAVGARRRI